MLVARITASILPAGRTQQEAVTAALLHDIGKLVLISDGDRRWAQLSEQARERQVPVHVVEQETDGVTHAHVGAHLLSLWGLPDGIVEAVAHHHDPAEVDGLAFDGVAAVHIANGLANELRPADRGRAAARPGWTSSSSIASGCGRASISGASAPASSADTGGLRDLRLSGLAALCGRPAAAAIVAGGAKQKGAPCRLRPCNATIGQEPGRPGRPRCEGRLGGQLHRVPGPVRSGPGGDADPARARSPRRCRRA